MEKRFCEVCGEEIDDGYFLDPQNKKKEHMFISSLPAERFGEKARVVVKLRAEVIYGNKPNKVLSRDVCMRCICEATEKLVFPRRVIPK